MRVALIAESYLPHMNGVTGSVLQVLHHLEAAGHETLVIAARAAETISPVGRARTELLRSVPLPSYPQVRVVFASASRIAGILRSFRPDVVHLASPFVLGWQALAAADTLKIPAVAIYQTDVVAYAEKYGMPQATAIASAHVARLHRRATLNLAPSRSSEAQLERLGVDRIARWGRGVDAVRFAPEHRSPAWRDRIAPGELVIGYVGRLAAEKQVRDLAVLDSLTGARVVIVGDGPERTALERYLPRAIFLGHLSGPELAEAMASFDVFVHPGESETFGQTIQEALASGVPVVATGAGGPLDLVHSSVDGWLYRPGDLADMRARVSDLLGDDAKRRAFAVAARESVRDRTWAALSTQLLGHYETAKALRPIDDAMLARMYPRPWNHTPLTSSRPQWSRYVALGDSLTEGLCDSSRMPSGAYRGWADRLAPLLAQTTRGGEAFKYANLAVRSRRVRDLTHEQIPQALRLRPDLVSILMGGNDLVRRRVDVKALADEFERGVEALRVTGADVLLVTAFLPRRRASRFLAPRFAAFNTHLRRIAQTHGCRLLDLDALPEISGLEMWADDRVHLRSSGHRFVAYRAAEALGVPDAEALGDLEAALHDDEPSSAGWIKRDVLPWMWRRVRGRTAGDGLAAKHSDYVVIPGPGSHRTQKVR
ncbi:phosphatidylinositol alpha 1,6-mannosyltransferase [Microbacterium endophyticum]|uniref:D-inositol 3-phosphate glycosyltransferase n=1 Tax=Microbacterium endophyticum TaxID=1526412 RepID=A0A7W4YMZ9_9MICO|nr:GDSL-type esterase/lipase family protein [Microbacterium endophyticum]MBB2976044.1 phosphatidylinositol alpha 1,6-mannosyltransferase [Microbacterium endophyticum]NIK35037.1 phosphatidylinositol alpha 1,6-mannosyltransferase [Microbacterium endophyticum]